MGLDMYLNGEEYFSVFAGKRPKRNGIELRSVTYDLGYWRKHPDLHGYIVKKFAGGEDECQPIGLNEEAILDIIKAIKEDRLPATSGFFYGRSQKPGEPKYEEDKAEDIVIFEKALEWLRKEKLHNYRSVVYQASW